MSSAKIALHLFLLCYCFPLDDKVCFYHKIWWVSFLSSPPETPDSFSLVSEFWKNSSSRKTDFNPRNLPKTFKICNLLFICEIDLQYTSKTIKLCYYYFQESGAVHSGNNWWLPLHFVSLCVVSPYSSPQTTTANTIQLNFFWRWFKYILLRMSCKMNSNKKPQEKNLTNNMFDIHNSLI